IGDALKVPDDIGRREITAIMKLYAFAQLNNPALRISGIDLPGRSQPWPQLSDHIGAGQIPQDKGIIQVITDKAIPFKTLIGLANRHWHIASSHGYAQHCFRTDLLEHRAAEESERAQSGRAQSEAS